MNRYIKIFFTVSQKSFGRISCIYFDVFRIYRYVKTCFRGIWQAAAELSGYTAKLSLCTAEPSRYTAELCRYTAKPSRYTAELLRYTAEPCRYAGHIFITEQIYQ
jgi:hypothetical protein